MFWRDSVSFSSSLWRFSRTSFSEVPFLSPSHLLIFMLLINIQINWFRKFLKVIFDNYKLQRELHQIGWLDSRGRKCILSFFSFLHVCDLFIYLLLEEGKGLVCKQYKIRTCINHACQNNEDSLESGRPMNQLDEFWNNNWGGIWVLYCSCA